MRFQFRFERILRLVGIQELQKKLELAATKRQLLCMETQIKELQAMTAEILGSQTRDAALTSAPYRLVKVEMNRLEIHKLEKSMSEEREKLEQILFELEKHYKKRKALELIREKREREYQKNELNKNQKFLDEVSMQTSGKTFR